MGRRVTSLLLVALSDPSHQGSFTVCCSLEEERTGVPTVLGQGSQNGLKCELLFRVLSPSRPCSGGWE